MMSVERFILTMVSVCMLMTAADVLAVDADRDAACNNDKDKSTLIKKCGETPREAEEKSKPDGSPMNPVDYESLLLKSKLSRTSAVDLPDDI
jgi:hypothetical protein